MPLFFPVFGLLHWVDRIILALRKRGLHVFCVIVETLFDLIPNKGLPHYTLKRYCYEIYVFIGVIAKGCESERWDLGVKNLRKSGRVRAPQDMLWRRDLLLVFRFGARNRLEKKLGGRGPFQENRLQTPAYSPRNGL